MTNEISSARVYHLSRVKEVTLNEILVARRRDLRKSGLAFVNRGKEVMKSLTMFVKESIKGDASSSKDDEGAARVPTNLSLWWPLSFHL